MDDLEKIFDEVSDKQISAIPCHAKYDPIFYVFRSTKIRAA